MKARDFLQQLSKLDRLITNKLIEKEQWRAIAEGSASASDNERVQTSSSKQRMEEAVCRYIDIEAEINRNIDELIDRKRKVIEIIEQLPTAEYDVLHKIYVQYKDYYEIADEMSRSKSWVTKKHRTGLANVQRLLDEKERSEK